MVAAGAAAEKGKMIKKTHTCGLYEALENQGKKTSRERERKDGERND